MLGENGSFGINSGLVLSGRECDLSVSRNGDESLSVSTVLPGIAAGALLAVPR